jgi:peptidoglycan/LPS O-acetylase OafA/YrhL
MREHVPALDGLRGVAILLVLFTHARVPPSRDVPSALLQFAQSAGWIGVDLFFVLSGYLISGILLDLEGNWRALPAFYVRRALRIWPLYFLTVAIGLVVLPRLDTFASISATGREWEWLLFVQNLDLRPNPPQMGILWSLAVEEQMYLVLPALILFLPRRLLVWSLIGMVLLAPAWRIAALWLGASADANYILTPARADPFAVGALLALVARSGGVMRLGRWPQLIAATCGMVFVGLGAWLYDFHPFQLPMETFGLSMTALLFGSLLAMVLRSARLGAFFTWGPLRRFGRYSYAIYLFHYPVWILLFPKVPRPTLSGSLWPAQLLGFAMLVAVSFAGGWLSWHLLERHILALKRFVPLNPYSSTYTPNMDPAAKLPAASASVMDLIGTGVDGCQSPCTTSMIGESTRAHSEGTALWKTVPV